MSRAYPYVFGPPRAPPPNAICETRSLVLPRTLYRILQTAASSWKPATNVSGKAICKKSKSGRNQPVGVCVIFLEQFKKLACLAHKNQLHSKQRELCWLFTNLLVQQGKGDWSIKLNIHLYHIQRKRFMELYLNC